jgi:hypothetical protein
VKLGARHLLLAGVGLGLVVLAYRKLRNEEEMPAAIRQPERRDRRPAARHARWRQGVSLENLYRIYCRPA